LRILVCAGGTGGGIYPALSVLQALEQPTEILWVGGQGKMEEDLVRRAGYPFRSIPAAGVHGVGLKTLPGNILRLVRGFFAARQTIRAFQPDVMFFTGGYVAAPVALAGRNVPIALFVPDIEPGLALKTLSRFANTITLVAEESEAYFSSGMPNHPRLEVIGYPTRKDLTSWKREPALQRWGLSPEKPTLLVFGGSLGARSINRAVLSVLCDLLDEMQIIHLTGKLDWDEVETAQKALSPARQSHYRPIAYLHEMGAAYAAGDLVLSRGGASSIGEFPAFGLPAVIVPYPHAWRYQKVNADYLVQRGAATMLRDEDLTTKMLPTVSSLMQDNEKRQQMAAAMRSLNNPAAAKMIADRLVDLGTKS